MAGEKYELFEHDVIVVGAGGAGLRACIEAGQAGLSVGLVCKSLLGKAHTVMAEGGVAAALANVETKDNWKVHFRDTMRGGKMLNNYRMAQLHAQEAPDRVNELEAWGAVFDRTEDGRILQRNFGGHLYPRLAHVGDRTGLEMIRTLQDKAVHTPNVKVYMECTIYKLLKDGDRIAGAVGYWRETGRFIVFKAKSVILATGGVGKSFKVTSNSWEYTGDGQAIAYDAGAELIDMEFVQFHPTGMMWPLSVKGTLVTEGVRGEGGVLKNNKGERFMFKYIPEIFKKDYADTEEEAKRWLDGDKSARRPPELLTRDVVARAINSEVKSGRGSTHGGAYLDIASQRSAEYIKKKLPSMYHQFKELADVDITKTPMEVGPTTHYIMGGVRVNAETAESTVPGLFAAGEVAGGMHGSNRLGGNSLSDLLVFGRRAGMGAVNHAKKSQSVQLKESEIDSACKEMLASLERPSGENPFVVAQELQEVMNYHVNIIRNEKELVDGLAKIEKLKSRIDKTHVDGGRAYNPGWHQAMDLRAMFICSEAITRCAIERRESRGGHTREDYPEYDKELGKVNHILKKGPNGEMQLRKDPLPVMPAELQELFKGDWIRMDANLRIWRGDKNGGQFVDYKVKQDDGMVVLDLVHRIQAEQSPDLACRWNCKAGKCGSCSAEVNGKPRLMCMARMNTFAPGETITIRPLKAFPIIKDLVTDVSWNYEVNRKIPPFTPKPKNADGTWRMYQYEIDRIQEFRKCIECFLCQDVCHVLRDHDKKQKFGGPRFLVRAASLEMHPLDTIDRTEIVKDTLGSGLCNITKCCTEVCPESIHITDNAIIPLKERVVSAYFDPVLWLWRKIIGKSNKLRSLGSNLHLPPSF